MKITITQKNIDDANGFDGNNKNIWCGCPTEYAMLDAGFTEVSVGFITAKGTKDNKRFRFSTSLALEDQIHNWCSKEESNKFEPGEYELTEKEE
jgi:hypothetical protein